MPPSRVLRLVTLCAVLLTVPCGTAEPAYAEKPDVDSPQRTKSAEPVSVKIKAGQLAKDGKRTLIIELQLEKGWKIYGTPMANEDLRHLELRVAVKGMSTSPEIKYPSGQLLELRDVGKVRIYEDAVRIPVHIPRDAKLTYPLVVRVSYYPFTDRICGVRTTKKIEISEFKK
jgi:hypothetical protein